LKYWVEAVLERWSGHGEGGTVAKLVLRYPVTGDVYNAKPGDLERYQAVADKLNKALASVAETD
jgi:hypothetical protein